MYKRETFVFSSPESEKSFNAIIAKANNELNIPVIANSMSQHYLALEDRGE